MEGGSGAGGCGGGGAGGDTAPRIPDKGAAAQGSKADGVADGFVCARFDVPVLAVARMAVGELHAVQWREGPGAPSVARSVLVEDVSFCDGDWCLALTLTR